MVIVQRRASDHVPQGRGAVTRPRRYSSNGRTASVSMAAYSIARRGPIQVDNRDMDDWKTRPMDPALTEVAEQIGRLVIESGRLERALLALAYTGVRNLGASPERLRGLTARPLVIEVRRLAEEGAYATFDSLVIEAVAELVDEDTDGDVLAWRNRYVYASWERGEDGVYRGITLRDVAGHDPLAEGAPPVNEYSVESMLYLTFTVAKATDQLRRLSQAALHRAA
jgi:hypothetical protein